MRRRSPRRTPKLKNRVNRNLWAWVDEHRITMETLARRTGINRGYLVCARRRGKNWNLEALGRVLIATGQPPASIFHGVE